MKAKWIVPASLLSLLTLGWAANDYVQHWSQPLSVAPVSATPAIVAQAVIEEPPQIRTAEVSFTFATQTQTESEQDAELSPRGYAIARGRESATIVFSPVAVTLDAPQPFLALSAAWDSQSAEDAIFTLSVRASTDGSAWGDWQLSSLDGDPRAKSGLFFLPRETRFIQYRIELGRDPRGASPAVSAIRFRFISPGATPASTYERWQQRPSFEGRRPGNRLQSATAGGLFPKPAVLSRFDWNCPDGDKPHRGSPSYTTVTHLIVHHTATGNDASDWPAVVRSIWNFHVFTNGWSDVGYNYLIDPNGMIYEGRAGGDNVVGAHFSCANSGTMGTALLGNFTTIQPTNQTLTSLKYLLAWKSDQRSINPLGINYHGGTQLNLQNVSGHRDANASTAPNACPGTECPGNSLYPLLPTLRNETKSLVDPNDDFTIAADISSVNIGAGNTANLTINTATTKGIAQPLSLSVSGLPAGVTATLGAANVTSGNSTSLALNVAANAIGGIYPLTITATGSTIRAQQINLNITGIVATVSAANYQGATLARDSIVAAFGAGLATVTEAAATQPLPTTLAGVSVRIKDSVNADYLAPLFFVSPGQINWQIPSGVASGAATVTVLKNNSVVALGNLQIANVAPALFTADASGNGLAAAYALRVKPDNTQLSEPVILYDDALKRFVAVPLDLSIPGDQVYLILFGTGFRYRSAEDMVKVKIGGLDAQVLYAGTQNGFAGLDQINVLLPVSLKGRGEVEIEVTIDGQAANVVKVSID